MRHFWFSLFGFSLATKFDCLWDSGYGVFNLCELQKTDPSSGYYQVDDNRDNGLYNYTYILNICADVVSRPTPPKCWNTTLRDTWIPESNGYCTSINGSHCENLIPIETTSYI